MSYLFLGIFVLISFAALLLFAQLQQAAPQILAMREKSDSLNGNISYFNPEDVLGKQTMAIPAKQPNDIKITPEPWGIAKKVDEKTWTIKVKDDQKMATSDEIFQALNYYRKQNGRRELIWDTLLAEFATKRSNTFVSIEKLDGHAGFNDYFKIEQNLKNMGFSSMGENSSYGYTMLGVHLIEWIFASNSNHNDNQLDAAWTHVGIGVNETAVDIVFGGK